MKLNRKLLFVFLLMFQFAYGETTAPESTQELMSKWISLEAQKGKLSDDWELRRQQIQFKLDLFEKESSALQVVLNRSKSDKSDVDDRRAELIQSQNRLEVDQAILDKQLKLASAAIKSMTPKLPTPLQDVWAPKLSLLTQENVSKSEKLERLLNLLLDVDEFNKRVALHRSAMIVSDFGVEPNNVMVNQIYVGAGHGWYVSDDGLYYGYGRSEALGWRWWHGDQVLSELGMPLKPDDILRALQVLQNPTSATYLPLSIKLN